MKKLFDGGSIAELLEGGSPKDNRNNKKHGKVKFTNGDKNHHEKEQSKKQMKASRNLAKKLLDEDFIDDKSKKKLAQAYIDGEEAIRFELRSYYKNDSAVFSDKQDLACIFSIPKFAKAITKAMEETETIYPEVYAVIADLFDAGNEAMKDKELLEEYLGTLSDFNSKAIKKLSKKLDIKKNAALELILNTIVPDPQNKGTLYGRYRMLLKTINKLVDLGELEFDKTPKEFKLILDTCFGEGHIGRFINFLLTETKRGRVIEEDIDDFVLSYLEKLPKSEIRQIISGYAKKVSKQPKARKRFDFTALDDEDYPKIVSVIEKQIACGRNKNCFKAS